jgi:hypothetical protein
MAKRGPKPKPNHLKAVSGTIEPGRSSVVAFEPSYDEPTLPPDFEDLKQSLPKVATRVLRMWNGYVAKFRRRNQGVADFENALYSMCALEVRVRMLEESGAEVPMAMVNGLRVYQSEFQLTPAGNVKPAGTPAGNKFKNNGRPQKP